MQLPSSLLHLICGGGGHHLVSSCHTGHIIQKKEGGGNSVSCADQILALQVPHSNHYT